MEDLNRTQVEARQKRPTVRWLVLVAAVLVFAGTAAIAATLKQAADDRRQAQVVLARLEEHSVRLNTVAFAMLANRRVTKESLAEVALHEKRMASYARDLRQLRLDPGMLDPLSRQRVAYGAAMQAVANLAAAGRFEAAQRLAGRTALPEHHEFEEAVEHANETLGEEATDQVRNSNLWTALTTVFALLVASTLLWRFDRERKSAYVAKAEGRALARSEEHFRSLVQNSSDLTLIIDPDSTIRYASPSSQRILGYPPEHVAGTKLADLCLTDEAELVNHCVGECLTDAGSVNRCQFHVKHADGRLRVLETMGSNRLDDPATKGIIINARDMTEQKTFEEQLAVRNTQLEDRNSELSALYELSEAVGTATDMEWLFKRALDALTRIPLLKDCDRGGFLRISEDRLRLVTYFGARHSPEFLLAHNEMKVGDCLCGLAVQTGEVITSDDCFQDPRHTIRVPGMTPHGHIIVPLKAMGRVVSVLYLYTPAGLRIDEHMSMLVSALGNRIGAAIENLMLYQETKELSLHDPLTGLANRRMMSIALDESFARAKRLERSFSVVMLDLDYFKKYNDSHGHAAGDKLLANVAGIIQSETREIDLAVRYGGEEFLIILPEAGSPEAVAVAERIRQRVMETPFPPRVGSEPAHVTISPGVATYDRSMAGADQLVEMADRAMYEAKRKGRNRVEVWAA